MQNIYLTQDIFNRRYEFDEVRVDTEDELKPIIISSKYGE